MAARTPATNYSSVKAVLKNGVAALVANDNPRISSHYFALVGDGDTWTQSNWRGMCPSAYFTDDTAANATSAVPTLSGTTLTVTFQADAATAGTLMLERL